MTCTLISCQGQTGPKTGWVQVRAFPIVEAQPQFLNVNWSPDGTAILHRECWNNLVLATEHQSDECFVTDLEVALVKDAQKTAEFHDPDLFIEQEGRRIVHMLMHSEYPVIFTGAGISTAAGIGDYRGINGKWTERDKIKTHGKKGQQCSYRNPSVSELRPTYTHEAIAKLVDMGVIKHVLSQNIDSLHLLSGVPPYKLSELHGNALKERCEKCGTRYDITQRHCDRNTPTLWKVPKRRCGRCHMNHRSGRLCEQQGCDGYLVNTIINFGDLLENHIIQTAVEHAQRADMFISLGSTLGVTPANSLVTMGREPHRLVICNRQATEFDRECSVRVNDQGVHVGSRVFGDCDKLMAVVMGEILGLEALQEWEQGREERMTQYDKARE